MNLSEFKQSVATKKLPGEISPYLQSLWYDALDDWHHAHELIQDISDKNAAWIHAYLHRKEGDIWNADYWYSKAGKKRPSLSLGEEWDQIASALL